MAGFKVGDKVKIVSVLSSSISVGDTAVVVRVDRPDIAIRLDNPRDLYASSTGDFHCWTSEVNLALVEEPAGEKMIPASKVREIARLYAQRHGWCDVVDDALREMGAQDDTIVEVTYTQTRTVRLQRSDLDTLVSANDLHSLQSNNDKRSEMFRGRSVPSNVSLTSRGEVSEPVEVKSETTSTDGWVDCGVDRPAVGTRVRVRPDRSARSIYNFEIEAGRQGEVYAPSNGYEDIEDGYVLVNFGTRYYVKLEDLQVRSS